jgi:uncharacterized delta-60 repeat protein
MKKKPTSQSASFTFCILLGLLIFFAGIVLALFAATDPQSFTRDVTRNGDIQVSRADRDAVTSSGAVQEAWVARYNGPTNEYDEGQAIAVDGSGSVYVTGYSGGDYVTIKYDTSGQEQWVARYNGGSARAIAVDSSGNVYVTGQSVLSGGSLDYATIKYDSAGHEQWVARYNGPASDYDSASSIVVDSSGNVYVTGESLGSGTGLDYATIKYNSAGQQQWVARYNGPANGDDYAGYAGAIVLDDSGNVYVTGGSAGSGTSDDYATIKYNSAGRQQWVARYNGPGNGGDHANAIAIDPAGNVCVTGFSTNLNGNVACATVKYDSGGGRQEWVAQYSGSNILDYGIAIAVDSSHNIYVAGTSFASVTNGDYVVIKYNSAGQEQWVARYDAGLIEYATAIALDTSNNIYVTGTSSSTGTNSDYATVKYNSFGQEQWAARYDGPGHDFDRANAIAIDGSGNVYVTGRSYGSGTGLSDCATIKYVQPTPRVTPRPRPSPAPRP